jgi:rubrerythrin
MMKEKTMRALGIIRDALEFEDEGHRFYARSAEETGDPLGREMFRFLAGEEMKHIAKLRSVEQKLTKDEAWESLAEKGIAAERWNIRSVAQGLAQEMRLRSAIGADTSGQKALEIAEELERRGKAFYENAWRRIRDQAGRDLFAFLEREEEEHLRVITATREYFENPRGWLESVQGFDLSGDVE